MAASLCRSLTALLLCLHEHLSIQNTPPAGFPEVRYQRLGQRCLTDHGELPLIIGVPGHQFKVREEYCSWLETSSRHDEKWILTCEFHLLCFQEFSKTP